MKNCPTCNPKKPPNFVISEINSDTLSDIHTWLNGRSILNGWEASPCVSEAMRKMLDKIIQLDIENAKLKIKLEK